MEGPMQNASFLFEQERENIQRNFSVMIKTVGPVCNLDCDYCYYLEKSALYPDKKLNVSSFLMPEHVLEKLIKDYITAQAGKHVEFIWHGGEPTLAGIPYFQRVVELQQKYKEDKEISNSFQTNGTLIDEAWAKFLADNHFLCGISIDGTQKFHDNHRRFSNGKGSWEKVMECIELFNRYGVEFNTMSVVNATNSKYPAAIYEFLKSTGSHFLQFTPIVEQIATDERALLSIVPNEYTKETAIMEENVGALEWGNFLCRIFDIWVKNDVGNYYINYFDNTLAAYMGQSPSLCSMAQRCGCALAIEHNGDAYCCDHFVFPEFLLGNIHNQNIGEFVKSDKQLFFEQRKTDTLAQQCRNCSFLMACGGDCPKNRIVKNSDGEYVSCLCEGFQLFFKHTRKYFEFMANELKEHRAPANVMKAKL